MSPKICLISGGTEGIGKATVLKLLKDGNNVVIFSRNKLKCLCLRKPLNKKYSSDRFLIFSADVGNELASKKSVKKVIKKFGIKVTIICPGMVKTEFLNKKGLEKRKQIQKRNISHPLSLEDISNAISFVCNQSKHATSKTSPSCLFRKIFPIMDKV